MMFDVCIITGKNERGRDIFVFNRVRDIQLSEYLRRVQNNGGYIHTVRRLIPLNRMEKDSHPIDTDLMKGVEEEEIIGGY